MKRNNFIIGFTVIFFLMVPSCKKIKLPEQELQPKIINLGKKSINTKIKSMSRVDNIFTTEFYTTPGSKYSIQIIPFGSDIPIKTDGFTALDTVTKKTYDLHDLKKMDYDMIFIDIDGNEVKYPILIK